MKPRKRLMLFVGLITAITASAFADGLQFTSNVSREHPLFSVEKKARTRELENAEDYQRFAVKSQDSLEQTYRKLLRLVKTQQHFSDKTGDTEISPSSVRKFTARQCRKAHELYPGSAAIASITLRQVHRVSGDLAKMKIVVPYVQERSRVPGISRSIWAVFDHSERNYEPNQEEKYRRLLDLEKLSIDTPKRTLQTLARAWGARIDPDYSTSWTKQKVNTIREELTLEEKCRAQRAWRNLIQACYGATPAQIKFKIKQRLARADKRLREKKAKDRKKQQKKMEKQVRNRAMQILERLEKKPNNYEDVKRTMQQAFATARMAHEQWGAKRIPNYDAIKKKLGQQEAAVLNLVYQFHVLHEYDKVSRKLKTLLKAHPEDIRLLMLKAQRAIRNEDYKEAFNAINRIIEIAPENTLAQNIRERIVRTTQLGDNTTEN